MANREDSGEGAFAGGSCRSGLGPRLDRLDGAVGIG